MILEARAARRRGRGAGRLPRPCSVQDVRDRPLEAQQQADQQHAKFDDEKSEFTGYLRLWKWLQDARGGKAVAKSRKRDGGHRPAHKPAAAQKNQVFLACSAGRDAKRRWKSYWR